MIRFKCIYCGHRILAPDGGHGKKGKCPNCGHTLVVPHTTKGRPAVSSDHEPIPDRPKLRKMHIPAWETSTHFETNVEEEAAMELYKESFGFFIPTYDKLSLFLMAVTLILLFVINTELRDLIRDLIYHLRAELSTYCFLLFPICFAIYLFYFMVSELEVEEETDRKKKFMLAFAMLANVGSGIFAGIYVIKNTTEFTWLFIFPVWNIINGVLLLLMLQYKFIDDECISDRKATFFQIILGLLAVCVILFLCNYVFKLYWAITFSICIVYTTSFDRALQNVLPGLTDRDEV